MKDTKNDNCHCTTGGTQREAGGAVVPPVLVVALLCVLCVLCALCGERSCSYARAMLSSTVSLDTSSRFTVNTLSHRADW